MTSIVWAVRACQAVAKRRLVNRPYHSCTGTNKRALRQAVLKFDPLNAALLQQSAAGPALRRAGDLAAIGHHVRTHRVRETIVAAVYDGRVQGAAVFNPESIRGLEIALP